MATTTVLGQHGTPRQDEKYLPMLGTQNASEYKWP